MEIKHSQDTDGIPHQRPTVYLDIWLPLKYIPTLKTELKKITLFSARVYSFHSYCLIEKLTLTRKRERENIGLYGSLNVMSLIVLGVWIFSPWLMVLFGRFQRCGLAGSSASLEVDTGSLKTPSKLVLVAQEVSSQLASLLAVAFLLPSLPALPVTDACPSGALSPNKPFFLSVVLVRVFYHSNRKVTNKAYKFWFKISNTNYWEISI